MAGAPAAPADRAEGGAVLAGCVRALRSSGSGDAEEVVAALELGAARSVPFAAAPPRMPCELCPFPDPASGQLLPEPIQVAGRRGERRAAPRVLGP